MIEVLPAILPYSFKELEENLELLKGVSEYIQIDVTDGKFAGKASWPLAKPDNNFEEIVRQERGLPFWEDFEFEIDLMVSNPFPLAKDFISAGASRIIFHADTIKLEDDKLILDQLKNEGLVEIGIAVGSNTDPELIKELLEFADFFQVMTCNPIGFQGSSFDEKSLEKIKLIRSWLPNMSISCDGSMNPETAELVINSGATRIVSGSFVLNSVNPIEAIEELKGLV